MKAKQVTLRINAAGINNRGSLWLITLLLTIAFISTAVNGAVPIEDIDISDHIEREFKYDPTLPNTTIDASTKEGIVTLNGSVTNLLTKERAARIAQTVRGVRSVINQIEVEPLFQYSAKLLEDSVEKALLYDAATDSYEINVKADDKGQVALTGMVDSWAERDLAELVVKGVNGVVNINNEIGINVKSKRPDIEIKPEIEKRLTWDTLVDDELIVVEVDEGKVFLKGVVGSAAEKRRAELDAWVSGVRAVDASGLEVEKWAREKVMREQNYVSPSDSEVRKAVQDAIFYDPRVNSYAIGVKVSNGKVTLRGVVDNIQAKKAVISDARNTVGVVRVNNLIKVRNLPERAGLNDNDIAENVRAALLRNPFTNSYEIDVEIQNGIVRLNGIVDSYFEKGEAENVAQKARGVTSVRNLIKVSDPDLMTYNPYVYDWSIYDFPWYSKPAKGSNKSDWEIKADIEDELFWSPFVDADEVTVTVIDGTATLTGNVDSWTEYNAAWENAVEGGAISVINKLNVE